jgi:hypothetical protein
MVCAMMTGMSVKGQYDDIWDGTWLTVSVPDTAEKARKALLKKRIGSTVEWPRPDGKGTWSCTMVRVDTMRWFHVHYIHFNGWRLPPGGVDSLRGRALEELQAGVPFEQVAAAYGMDGNTTGDWGWKREDKAHGTFAAEVLARTPGEVFTVDIPENGWYYIVRKDEGDRRELRVRLRPFE